MIDVRQSHAEMMAPSRAPKLRRVNVRRDRNTVSKGRREERLGVLLSVLLNGTTIQFLKW